MLSLVEITAFRLESKLPPMRALEFIRDHVTFKLPYNSSYHMKTPYDKLKEPINIAKESVNGIKKPQFYVKVLLFNFC